MFTAKEAREQSNKVTDGQILEINGLILAAVRKGKYLVEYEGKLNSKTADYYAALGYIIQGNRVLW